MSIGSEVKTRSPAAQESVCSVAGSTLASYGPYSVSVIVPVASLVAPARVAERHRGRRLRRALSGACGPG
jgi:hypothetical protein